MLPGGQYYEKADVLPSRQVSRVDLFFQTEGVAPGYSVVKPSRLVSFAN
jgi:hypothetical protein